MIVLKRILLEEGVQISGLVKESGMDHASVSLLLSGHNKAGEVVKKKLLEGAAKLGLKGNPETYFRDNTQVIDLTKPAFGVWYICTCCGSSRVTARDHYCSMCGVSLEFTGEAPAVNDREVF